MKKKSCFDIKGRQGLYIHPESRFKQAWSIVIIFLLFYVAFIMPYNLAFNDDDNKTNSDYYVDIIADFVFMADIIVTCFSSYYDDKEGILISNNKKIIIRYLKGWFAIDLVASLPLSLVELYFNSVNSQFSFGGKSQYVKLIRFLRIPRLHRLLEVSKLG